MAKIGRDQYHKASEQIFGKLGYDCKIIGLCELLVHKDERRLFVEVAGKNLPYYGSDGREGFAWETFINALRLDKIDNLALKYDAEPWIVFCYAILDDRFLNDFSCIVRINDHNFGIKMITSKDYRQNMKPRSEGSWDVVDLQRDLVTRLTCDPENV
jgi:hypothetical protein